MNYLVLNPDSVKDGHLCFQEKPEFTKKDWRLYSYPETSRYAWKLDYDNVGAITKCKEFIKDLRKHGKKLGFTIRVRGSGSRAPQFRRDGLDLRCYDQSLPLKYAETVRIYINPKN